MVRENEDRGFAIRYALTRWVAPTRYRDDGRLEMDNNAAERAWLIVALGRKNFLFLGPDTGGERAKAIYWLLNCPEIGNKVSHLSNDDGLRTDRKSAVGNRSLAKK